MAKRKQKIQYYGEGNEKDEVVEVEVEVDVDKEEEEEVGSEWDEYVKGLQTEQRDKKGDRIRRSHQKAPEEIGTITPKEEE